MEAVVLASTLIGSFATAFFLQKAALEALLRAMAVQKDPRQ
jgi:hypothetical protein